MSGTENYGDLVDDCERQESMLTDWERNFVAAMREKLDEEDWLTDKEIVKLKEIHARFN